MQNQEGPKSRFSNLPHRPGALLTLDEIATLREISIFLSRQYSVISPIADYYEERLAVSTMPQRCKDCKDIVHCPEWKILPKYLSTEICPRDAQRYSSDNTLDGEHKIRVDACLNTHGLRGRSGCNPIDAIRYDLEVLTNKIKKLCDTGILQTSSTQEGCLTSDHQLDDI